MLFVLCCLVWVRSFWQSLAVPEFLCSFSGLLFPENTVYSQWISLVVGGTDIISCFMGHNVTVPVYKGEIQARNLGMAVEAWNDEGNYDPKYCAQVENTGAR